MHCETITTNNTTAMAINYIIDCNHCGSHSEYKTSTNGLTMRMDSEMLLTHVDTQCAIRCPICRSRLNNSERDFISQVRVERIA